MTSTAVPAVPELVRRRLSAPAVLRLALTEARRMLLHPAMLAIALIVLVAVVADPGQPTQRSVLADGLEYIFLLYYGLAVLFAANLVASSARRSGLESQFQAAPVSAQARTVASCLAVLGLVVPAGLAAAASHALTYAGETDPKALSVAELLVIPLCALGAGMLGVTVARWLPWPGAALLVGVLLVLWVGATHELDTWAWFVPWSTSHTWTGLPALEGGSQRWHAVYLVGLAGLAALAAVLRHPGHRRGLLVASALMGAATLTAGLLQLP